MMKLHELLRVLKGRVIEVLIDEISPLCAVDDPLYAKYWQLLDRLVQQVVLQQRQGVDPDLNPASINVDSVLQQ